MDTNYIYIYIYIVDFGKSNKMWKISGKVDIPKYRQRYFIKSFFRITFWLNKDKTLLNPLSVFWLSHFSNYFFTHTHTHTHTHIYIYIYIYIYKVHTIGFQTFFVQAFTIVVNSWKFSVLLLYILWDENLQLVLEYTLLKPDCHCWWISKMQSGREDTLEDNMQ